MAKFYPQTGNRKKFEFKTGLIGFFIFPFPCTYTDNCQCFNIYFCQLYRPIDQ